MRLIRLIIIYINIIMNEKIFIQIASYRDTQLFYTIQSAFKNSKYPENLVFCVCWQKDDTETLYEYENNPQVKLIKIPYEESLGACWARNQIQQHYNDEKYTLQLDSHHRFINNWDIILIEMYNQLKEKGHNKPLITTYLPSFNPEKDPEERCMEAWKIDFKEKTFDKQVLFIPSVIPNFKSLTEPVKAKFYSAHFAFTTGEFAKEVQHDPELYFTGEEMSITVRAFTYGYELFHPHKVIAWHEYTRSYRVKHWDNDTEWWKKDKHSKEHYLTIFNNYGKYGLGKEKTIEEYIEYSGIDFLTFDTTTNNDSTTTNNITINISDDKIIYKKFDQEWRDWIKENINTYKVSTEAVKKILIDAKFDPKYIDYEINFFL